MTRAARASGAGVYPERETNARDKRFVIVLPVAGAVLLLTSYWVCIETEQTYRLRDRSCTNARMKSNKSLQMSVPSLLLINLVCFRTACS